MIHARDVAGGRRVGGGGNNSNNNHHNNVVVIIITIFIKNDYRKKENHISFGTFPLRLFRGVFHEVLAYRRARQ